jgi:hypothetical protein
MRLLNVKFLGDYALVFGPVSMKVEVSGYNVDYVKFYVDDKLVNTTYNGSFEYVCNERCFGFCKVKSVGFDDVGGILCSDEVTAVVFNRGVK